MKGPKGTISQKLRKVVWEGPYYIKSIRKTNVILKHVDTKKEVGPIHVNRLKRGYVRFGHFSDNPRDLERLTQNGTSVTPDQSGHGVNDQDSPSKGPAKTDKSKKGTSSKPGMHSPEQSIEDKDVLPDGWYQVKKIIGSFYDRKKRQRFFKVWWAGFPRSKSTWELETNLPLNLREAYFNKL